MVFYCHAPKVDEPVMVHVNICILQNREGGGSRRILGSVSRKTNVVICYAICPACTVSVQLWIRWIQRPFCTVPANLQALLLLATEIFLWGSVNALAL